MNGCESKNARGRRTSVVGAVHTFPVGRGTARRRRADAPTRADAVVTFVFKRAPVPSFDTTDGSTQESLVIGNYGCLAVPTPSSSLSGAPRFVSSSARRRQRQRRRDAKPSQHPPRARSCRRPRALPLRSPSRPSTRTDVPSPRTSRPSNHIHERRAPLEATTTSLVDGAKSTRARRRSTERSRRRRRWERRRVRSSSRARVVDGDGKRHREAAAEIKTKKEKKKGEGGLATIRGSRRFARGARVVAVGAVRTTRVDVEIGRDDARDRRATDGGPNGGRGWTALSNGRSVGHSSRANE